MPTKHARTPLSTQRSKLPCFFLAFLVLTVLVCSSFQIPKVYAAAPPVAFTTVSVTSVHTCPLDTHTFVIAYHDETNDDFSFQIYDTNGTQILAETDVDTTSGGSLSWTSVGVSAFNSTTFVIGWFDATDADATFAVYNKAGTKLSGPTDVDTDVGTYSGGSVQVSCFNSTHFVIGWFDRTDLDATFAVYTSSSVKIAGPIDADDNVGDYCYSVSVSTFNSTTFVIAWYDYIDYDVTFSVYSSAGTLLAGPIDADETTSSGTVTSPVSVSTFNSTYFVIGWYDYVDQDTTFAVYDSLGNLKTGPIDVDTTAGANSYPLVQVPALNSTAFVISWYDYVDFDLSYTTYLSDNTLIASNDVESWPTAANNVFRYQSPCSQETGTGIKIFNDNWIIAYANTTSQAIWRAFYPNGTAWDGTIPSEEPPAGEERSFTFTETLKPTATLNQWQEHQRTLTQTVTSTVTMIQLQEQQRVFTQTVTPTETVTYWQEQHRFFSETAKPSIPLIYSVEAFFQLINTLTPTATLYQWQEHSYVFSITTTLSTTLSHWLEGIMIFTETFTSTLKPTATLFQWQEQRYVFSAITTLTTTLTHWLEGILEFIEYTETVHAQATLYHIIKEFYESEDIMAIAALALVIALAALAIGAVAWTQKREK